MKTLFEILGYKKMPDNHNTGIRVTKAERCWTEKEIAMAMMERIELQRKILKQVPEQKRVRFQNACNDVEQAFEAVWKLLDEINPEQENIAIWDDMECVANGD